MNGIANLIIILFPTSEKLREMTNFGILFNFPLFGNNQHYVKLDIEESVPTKAITPIKTIAHFDFQLSTLNFQLTINSQLKNIHRNHRTSLSIGNGIVMVLR